MRWCGPGRAAAGSWGKRTRRRQLPPVPMPAPCQRLQFARRPALPLTMPLWQLWMQRQHSAVQQAQRSTARRRRGMRRALRWPPPSRWPAKPAMVQPGPQGRWAAKLPRLPQAFLATAVPHNREVTPPTHRRPLACHMASSSAEATHSFYDRRNCTAAVGSAPRSWSRQRLPRPATTAAHRQACAYDQGHSKSSSLPRFSAFRTLTAPSTTCPHSSALPALCRPCLGHVAPVNRTSLLRDLLYTCHA